MTHRLATFGAAWALAFAVTPGPAAELTRPVVERFAAEDAQEVPDFQRHVLPLMGRLGCNGRACHGSFQGQGGLRLSLFGYDFKTDHDALMKDGSKRVVLDNPDASKVLQKPTLGIPHKGGKRMDEETWQYRVLLRWVEGGAKNSSESVRFEKLEVIPSEIVFESNGQKVPLQVIAHWADGAREDVTCISRFRTNDDSIAEVNEDGLITSKGKGDTHVVAFYDNGVAVTQVLAPVSDQLGPKYPEVPTPTKVDALVVAKLRKLGIVPSGLTRDEEFLRRVSLDMTGTLPTPDEVESFRADRSPSKRSRKIDELLSRPAYAAWWANKLCDFTGNNPRNLINQAGGQVAGDISKHWYDWIARRVGENTPYDQLIAGIVLATSRKPGQSYEEYAQEESAFYRTKSPADFTERDTMPYYWARRNVRTPEEKALNFSYTFLGVRLECAQCHKHPFDQWTQDDFKQFTAFFAPVGYGLSPEPEARKVLQKYREDLGLNNKMGGEIQRLLAVAVREGKTIPWQEVFINPNGMRARQAGKKAPDVKGNRVATPKLLGGEEVTLAEQKDPRAPLMEWMRRKDNPYFARAFVNRVWAVYFGSGIINPPDDSNLANPPSNAALLDHLADGFIEHKFDMKWLHREIGNSQTYQRTWQPNETNRHDERNFSRAVVRRLPAEVLVDAVAQATASTAELPRLAANTDERAIGPRASFLGARGRNTEYASRVFGRSTRETNCDCTTSTEPNLLQSIYLQNDQEVLAAIERQGNWVDERVGSAVQSKANAQKTEALAVLGLAKQADVLEKRSAGLKGDEQDKQAGKLNAQLDKLRETLKTRQKRLDELVKAAPPRPFDADQVIREAYERTLSRKPSKDEAELARGYFRESGNDKGMRDLLWALLNTKEFITNH